MPGVTKGGRVRRARESTGTLDAPASRSCSDGSSSVHGTFFDVIGSDAPSSALDSTAPDLSWGD